MKKICLIILGFIGVILGVIGAILPLIPAFPFLLLAAVCFSKSSQRLDAWFKGTQLYKKNLESFVSGQGMTKATKIRVITLVTALMAFGFYWMGDVPIGRIVLFFVWVFYLVYFIRFVKNYQPNHEPSTP